MGYEGSLAESPFPEVLQRIARTAETGILTLQGQDEIIGVTFLDGSVVSVDAVNQAPEDGLGHVLEEEGLVTREAFSSLVAEHQAGGGRVVDLLVERGFLTRGQLLEAMRQQTLRLCAQACGWRRGQFRFYRGEQVSYEHGIEPIPVDDLLTRLAGATAPTVRGGASRRAAAAPPRAAPQAPPPRSGVLRPPDPPRPADRAAFDIEMPDYEPLDVPVVDSLSGPGVPDPRPVEMPDAEAWDDVHERGLAKPRKERKPWFTIDLQKNWNAIVAPLLPGRLLGVGMLVGIAGLLVLAPARFLVPLDSQERIRSGFSAAVQASLYSKVDQAAKTFFLVRGEFPEDLGELVTLSLLASGDTQLPDARRLSYTEAPVSYLLAIEGEARVDSAVQTETISGNFLLDPDFSPGELVDSPPLVLLD